MDPLLEMYPGLSPYAYVLNNPIRYTDPTGMAAESNENASSGPGLRAFFNRIIHPNRKLLPDGRVERSGDKGGASRATGWVFKDPSKRKGRGEKAESSGGESSQQQRPPLEHIQTNLGSLAQSYLPQVDLNLPKPNPVSRIRINERVFDITGPRSIDFNFSTIGGVAVNWDGRPTIAGRNSILPLTNTQEQNLQAIANYLIANPQATVRFQYKSPTAKFHPLGVQSLMQTYQMSFNQIANYLIRLGVTNPNQRILMSFGTNLGFIINPNIRN